MNNEEKTVEQILKERDTLLFALENIDAALSKEMVKFTASNEELDCDEAVTAYLSLREARELLKSRYERHETALVSFQDQISNALHAFIHRTGVKSISTKLGTVFIASQSTARVADRQVFLSFLRKNDLWHLATVGANKKEVATYLEEKENLPPGVDFTTRQVPQIRRK